ncbi:DUF6705 family protein [Flavobacterium soli]|uniref:DUF6705 family protein n=1 Tax=Flavobacterium soli TaxID=344881 RepID=UPI000418118F|nr:DUF6705 family protein [Flavobacterium soli]
MKKNILLSILFIIFGLLSITKASSQTNPFIGTWKYQNGNEIFYVTFFQVRSKIEGNYRKVLVNNNGIETQEIYRSNKFFNGTTIEWPTCFFISSDSTSLGGTINDNTIDFSNHPGRSYKSGILSVKLLPSCNACPVTAEWKVKRAQGIQLEGEPDYNIPTDIILTKVN